MAEPTLTDVLNAISDLTSKVESLDAKVDREVGALRDELETVRSELGNLAAISVSALAGTVAWRRASAASSERDAGWPISRYLQLVKSLREPGSEPSEPAVSASSSERKG